MTVELRPLGVRCNLRCHYCYQQSQRDALSNAPTYNINKMKEAVLQEGGPFTLFGGEPLLLPKRDLDELWGWGFVKWGQNSVQTNGTLIDEDHIELFERYNVHVGISIDGPAELNNARVARGSPQKTLDATAKTMWAIRRLCAAGRPPSLIVTLHKLNGTGERLLELQDWLIQLEKIGVTSVRLHVLEVENSSVATSLALSVDECVFAFRTFYTQQDRFKRLRFDVFNDMANLLLGTDTSTTCVWNACDPYTTASVRGVEGDGQRSNCGRTNKDGIDFVKAPNPGHERYLSLARTSQDKGGCRDCRYFFACKGQCPGTAIDGDWRNRTEYCELWKTLFTDIEDTLIRASKKPISDNVPLRRAVEQELVSAWARGKSISINAALRGSANRKRSAAAMGGAREAKSGSHDYMRIAWVSEVARMAWEPLLQRLAQVQLDLEIISVREGLRACGLTSITACQLTTFRDRLYSNGLATVSLAKVAASPAAYRVRNLPPSDGDPYDFRVVYGREDVVRSFAEAWSARDDQTMGLLLGYPSCCIAFFKEHWASEHFCDTTWPMAQRSSQFRSDGHIIDVKPNPHGNVLLRWLGIRPVSHLPCAFDCSETSNQSKALIELASVHGYRAEMKLLLHVLSWPVEWSCMHGSAEIKTPVFKISASSDPLPGKHTVRYLGSDTPMFTVQGVCFPFQHPNTGQDDVRWDTLAFDVLGPLLHEQNGFASGVEMAAYHSQIVEFVRGLLNEGAAANVVDLGCGNGALLKAIAEISTTIVPYGIDYDLNRISMARLLQPVFGNNFFAADIFDVNGLASLPKRFTLALLMPGRLLEAQSSKRAELLRFIFLRSQHVVLYAYDDWLQSFGGIRGLAAATGFEVLNSIKTGLGVETALARVQHPREVIRLVN